MDLRLGHLSEISMTTLSTMRGENAASQPPDLADVLLHETAVGWTRTYFKKHPMVRRGTLAEQTELIKAKFLECERYINSNHAVAQLCRDWPKRTQELVDSKGGRLKH